MAHTAHVPTDFVSTFRQRFAPLFGRKIGRQRSEQYLGGLLSGRAERRNVTSLAGTVDGATARALGWLLNKSPWQPRPVVEALQAYVGDTFGTTDGGTTDGGTPDGLFTLTLDSFVKRGDNAVGVEKQYVHHLGRTQNCQIGVFLAYGSERNSALVDAALYLPASWIENAARRARAGVPDSVEYQPRSALALDLLRRTRAAGHLPGAWVTTWHGEGFEPDLRARLDAEGWSYVLPVPPSFSCFGSPDGPDAVSVADLLAEVSGDAPVARRVWEPPADPSIVSDGSARRASWLVACIDQGTGHPVAFVANAPHGEAAGETVKTLERIVAARSETARMLAARCAGVSLDVYRVRGWDGWHRHVALALLASALRACLPVLPSVQSAAVEAAPSAAPLAAPAEALPAFPEPIVLHPADAASIEESDLEPQPDHAPEPAPPSAAGASTYHLAVDLAASDWRAVRAFQVWLVADEAGTILESSPARAEIERQEVGPRMEVRFESGHSLEQILAALDEVPEITVAGLAAEVAERAPAVESAEFAQDVQGGQESQSGEEEDDVDVLAALQAELAARTSAREAGLMPAFEAPAEVVGNAMSEAARALEPSRELVAAHGTNGHGQNGHGNGQRGNGGVALDNLAVPAASPAAPPAEAPVRAPAPTRPLPPTESPASQAPTESPASQAKEQARPAEEQMVVLDVGEESYGIPVQRVREIIRVPPITRVPNGPAFLEGVINLRGQVIPVMDLRKHLGIMSGDETRRSRVVVSELGRHTVGLMVDGVSEVVMVAEADIEPPPALIAGANDGQVRGVARLGDKLVLFLDPDRVLPSR